MSLFGRALDRKLIELVKVNTVIYDPSHPNYQENDTREVIWQKIGQALELPARKCKLRWANIRDMMRRKVTARLKHPEQPTSSYRYEQEMEFMLPFYREINKSASYEYGDYLDETSELPNEIYLEENMTVPQDEKPLIRIRKRKRESLHDYDSQCQELDISDPLDVFLMTIGNTLRKFSPYYLNQAKTKIFQTVQDYELEQIINKDSENKPSTSSTSDR